MNFIEKRNAVAKKYNNEYDGIEDFNNPHPVNKEWYKLKGKKRLKELGIRTPKIYGVYNDIDEVDFNSLPDEFVIHSRHGYSGRGVYAIVRFDCDSKGTVYYDLLKKKSYTLDKLKAKYKYGVICGPKEKPNKTYSKYLWIEELISNPLPFDWKFYTFNGKIGAIKQIGKNGTQVETKLWSANWENWNDKMAIHVYTRNDNLPEPKYKNELISTAIKISKEVKYPFVRIDLYESNGVYAGEITPTPSDIYFGEELDVKFGKMWNEAEKELNYWEEL
jgi:hypothetical protein